MAVEPENQEDELDEDGEAEEVSLTLSQPPELQDPSASSSTSTVQYHKWSPTANDPETANDPQNGPQMILDRKWSPKLTANDPERKIGMA